MLSPGETKPGEDTREGSDHLFRALCRLVPDSGLQFFDFSFPRHVADGVTRHFLQRRVVVDDQAVWVLAGAKPHVENDATSDATLRLQIDGRAAVTAVFDQWVPLPFLRFIARDGLGRARFDDGPFNWARVYIAAPQADDDPALLKGVIAFDTRTLALSREELAAYAMPTQDDARFGSTFALTDDAEQIASYLSEVWVQDWIEGVFPLDGARRARNPHAPELLQVAAYLTFLTVLRRASVLPSVQFFDARPQVVAPIPVDLVLDLGTSRSAAMLVEAAQDRPAIAAAQLLQLRDLSRPIHRYRGAFDSRIAFARPSFGSDVISRRSGRSEAFHWPSLVRTGPEAVHLSSQSRAGDGPTELATPKTHLRDHALREDAWRFAADPRSRVRRSQMISGRLLSHDSDVAGLLPGPAGSVKQIALRPRYALSSMMSFLIAEILLQAMSAINAPIMAGDPDRPAAVRQVRQIILCAPLTMPLEERDLLRERAEAAVDMLWRALDWDAAPDTAPPRPVIRLGLDETLAAQLAYLYNDIAHRFAGDVRTFLDIVGKSRPEFGVQPCIRVGAIDIGGGHTTMSIVTYASSAEAPISPRLLGAQRSPIAGGNVLDQLVATFIRPALAEAVRKAGGEDAARFIEQLTAPVAAGLAHDPMSTGQRLMDLWLRPAAVTLLQMTNGLAHRSGTTTLSLKLGDLVAAQRQPNAAVCDEFCEAITAIRAESVDLAGIQLNFRVDAIAQATRVALEPMVAGLSRALVASDCDAVLLSGWLARLPVLKSLLLEHMPWRPDRIIVLQDHGWLPWYPMSDQDRAASDGKDIALVGTLLAMAGGERLGFGGGESGFGFGGDFGTANDSGDSWRSAAPGRAP